jgi:hypothetical protein
VLKVMFVMASFTEPEIFGPSPRSMLWLLPLVAAIAVIYKATKLPVIKAGNFIRESVILFASIIAFIVIAALTLHVLSWLIIG